MKNNRLFGIIYILMLKKTVTAKELAERFEVSVRTIYRDIELLSSMNVPVYMTKGKNGGISLLDGYKLDKAMFTEEEQNQILFALQGFNKLSANDIAVFDKMKAVFDKDNKNWIDIDFTVWGKSAVQKSRQYFRQKRLNLFISIRMVKKAKERLNRFRFASNIMRGICLLMMIISRITECLSCRELRI